MRNSKQLIAGIDEAGRGPLAGPVVAAAVCFVPKLNSVKLNLTELSFHGLRDSKHLSAKQREEWYRLFLKSPCVQWGIGKVSERVIDRINIYEATCLAMERALCNLSRKVVPDFLFIDGTTRIQTAIPQKPVVKGDEKIALCAAASIVAKVTRDRLMRRYHQTYPEYGFDRHKGYGTKMHFEALRIRGPCPIHRRSFGPVQILDSRSP